MSYDPAETRKTHVKFPMEKQATKIDKWLASPSDTIWVWVTPVTGVWQTPWIVYGWEGNAIDGILSLLPSSWANDLYLYLTRGDNKDDIPDFFS